MGVLNANGYGAHLQNYGANNQSWADGGRHMGNDWWSQPQIMQAQDAFAKSYPLNSSTKSQYSSVPFGDALHPTAGQTLKDTLSNPIFQIATAAITAGQTGILDSLGGFLGGAAGAGAAGAAAGATGMAAGGAAGASAGGAGLGLSNNTILSGLSGLGSAGYNYSQTHNIGNAITAGILSGAGSYIGGNIGNALLPASSGSIASALEGGLGADLGSAVNSAIGSVGLNPLTGLGQIAGSSAGGTAANSFSPQGQPSNRGNYPFIPTQAGASPLPVSLGGGTGGAGSSPGTTPGINNLSGLTANQQASNLATQGLYGGGNGPQEQAYYGNLLNRQLVGSGGAVAPLSSLSPIEQSYNSKLGFGGAANSNNLLEMLSKWNPGA